MVVSDLAFVMDRRWRGKRYVWWISVDTGMLVCDHATVVIRRIGHGID